MSKRRWWWSSTLAFGLVVGSGCWIAARKPLDGLPRFRPYIQSETGGYYIDSATGKLVFVRKILLKDVMDLDEGKRLASGAQHGTKTYFQRGGVICVVIVSSYRTIRDGDRQDYPPNTFDRIAFWRPLNIFESLWVRAKHFHRDPIPTWSA